MRGDGRRTEKLFSYTSPEQLVPMDHPQLGCHLLGEALVESAAAAAA